jgi:hypothetical protein
VISGQAAVQQEVVEAVAAACRQVRQTLAGLLRQAGRGSGRAAK